MMLSPFQHYVMAQIDGHGQWQQIIRAANAATELKALERKGLIKPHLTIAGVWVSAKDNCKVPQNAMCGHYF